MEDAVRLTKEDIDKLVESEWMTIPELDRMRMSGEEVGKAISTIAARNGFAMLTPIARPEQPRIIPDPPDAKVYAVVGLGTELLFATREAAETFIALPILKRDYNYAAAYAPLRYVEPFETSSWGIREEAAYSKELYDRFLPLLKAQSEVYQNAKSLSESRPNAEANYHGLSQAIIANYRPLAERYLRATRIEQQRAHLAQATDLSPADIFNKLCDVFGAEVAIDAHRIQLLIQQREEEPNAP